MSSELLSQRRSKAIRIRIERNAGKAILELFSIISKRPASEPTAASGEQAVAEISAALAKLEETGIVIQIEAAEAGNYTTSEPRRSRSRQ